MLEDFFYRLQVLSVLHRNTFAAINKYPVVYLEVLSLSTYATHSSPRPYYFVMCVKKNSNLKIEDANPHF